MSSFKNASKKISKVVFWFSLGATIERFYHRYKTNMVGNLNVFNNNGNTDYYLEINDDELLQKSDEIILHVIRR